MENLNNNTLILLWLISGLIGCITITIIVIKYKLKMCCWSVTTHRMTILEIIIFGMFFTLFGVVTFITSLIVLMIAILPSQCWLEE